MSMRTMQGKAASATAATITIFLGAAMAAFCGSGCAPLSTEKLDNLQASVIDSQAKISNLVGALQEVDKAIKKIAELPIVDEDAKAKLAKLSDERAKVEKELADTVAVGDVIRKQLEEEKKKREEEGGAGTPAFAFLIQILASIVKRRAGV